MKDYVKHQHRLGFYQASPTPSDSDLRKYYRKYFCKNTSSPAFGVTYAENYLPEEKIYFLNRGVVAEHILDGLSLHRKTKSMIDVGCGEGFLAAYFERQGWEVECCDFSSTGVERQNPQLLSSFQQGDIFQILKTKIREAKRYDFVSLYNVLEHVRDPLGLLDDVKKIMHKKTVLCLAVPNDFSDFQKLLTGKGFTGETWFLPPEHLNYFTFKSMRNLLSDRKLKILKMLTDFPVELYLFNQHSNYWADRSKGKQAHLSRVAVTNFLFDQGVEKYIAYMEAAANCNFGRSIIAFVTK